MQEKFWMVYVWEKEGSRSRHKTLKDARAEAERLAELPENIRKEVYILEAMMCCRTTLLTQWEHDFLA